MKPTRDADKEVAPGHLSDLVRVDANVGFARAVLAGEVDGQRWSSGSGAFHVVHPYGMSLVWGDGVGQAFDDLIAHLRDGRYRTRDEWLQIDPRWAALPWVERLTEPTESGSAHLIVDSRINFEFDPELFRSMRSSIGIPDDWSIVLADGSDFARAGSVVPAEFWRDAEEFLERGGGWRAEKDGTRGALAFASFRFDDQLELGIETLPEVRGKGLAAAVASRMIEDLRDRGITPVWACRESNAASYRLALKLGFRPTKRLPYYRLAVPTDPASPLPSHDPRRTR